MQVTLCTCTFLLPCHQPCPNIFFAPQLILLLYYLPAAASELEQGDTRQVSPKVAKSHLDLSSFNTDSAAGTGRPLSPPIMASHNSPAFFSSTPPSASVMDSYNGSVPSRLMPFTLLMYNFCRVSPWRSKWNSWCSRDGEPSSDVQRQTKIVSSWEEEIGRRAYFCHSRPDHCRLVWLAKGAHHLEAMEQVLLWTTPRFTVSLQESKDTQVKQLDRLGDAQNVRTHWETFQKEWILL